MARERHHRRQAVGQDDENAKYRIRYGVHDDRPFAPSAGPMVYRQLGHAGKKIGGGATRKARFGTSNQGFFGRATTSREWD